jgi:hypothetical protein
MTEVYKLTCYACGRTVTVPPRDGELARPVCGALLQIERNADRFKHSRSPLFWGKPTLS